MTTPASQFVHTDIAGEQLARFQMLIGTVGAPDWWQAVFASGCCIAGGAALFVADAAQCINSVGDIDIWVPRALPITELVESLCAWLDAQEQSRIIQIRKHVVTVFTEHMSVQFVCGFREHCVLEVLDGFDYDYVQCGIYAQPPPGTGMRLVLSQAALAAHRTRAIGFANDRSWLYLGVLELVRETVRRQREEKRISKMEQKGFYCNLPPRQGCSPAPLHVCAPEHRIPRPLEFSKENEYGSFNACKHLIAAVSRSTAPLMTPEELIASYGEEAMREHGVEIVSYREQKRTMLPVDDKHALGAPQNTWRAHVPLELVRFYAMCRDLIAEQQKKTSANRKSWYACRNLQLLVDAQTSEQFAELRNSILSDANKVGTPPPLLAMMMISMMRHDTADPKGKLLEVMQCLNVIKSVFFE